MANDKTMTLKKDVVSEIADKIKNNSSVIFVDYRGLTVSEITNIRRSLRESGSDFKIYKNTLTKLATNSLNLDLDEYLVGPSAVVFSNDAVEPVKVLDKFSKKNELLKLKVGIIDNSIIGLDGLKEIATIPSREGLLTMLAGGMIQTVRDLSCCLHLYAEQLEEK